MTDKQRALEQLNDISNGIVADLLVAMRSRAVWRELARYAGGINRAGYGDLFGATQDATLAHFTLAISKIFERAGGRYPTRSLPAILAALDNHADVVPIVHREAVVTSLERLGIDTKTLAQLRETHFTRELVRLLQAACPDSSKGRTDRLSEALGALRASRDKEVAHHEAIARASLPRTTWILGDELVCFAARALDAVAFGYLSTVVVAGDESFIGQEDAGDIAVQVDQLMAALRIPQAAT